MRSTAAFLHLAVDAAGHVVAGEELGRAAAFLVALGVFPAFLFGVGGLRFVIGRDVVEHEALAVFVA